MTRLHVVLQSYILFLSNNTNGVHVLYHEKKKYYNDQFYDTLYTLHYHYLYRPIAMWIISFICKLTMCIRIEKRLYTGMRGQRFVDTQTAIQDKEKL
jgi:uncharacterized membrane protein